jgi:hypothetical protein
MGGRPPVRRTRWFPTGLGGRASLRIVGMPLDRSHRKKWVIGHHLIGPITSNIPRCDEHEPAQRPSSALDGALYARCS